MVFKVCKSIFFAAHLDIIKIMLQFRKLLLSEKSKVNALLKEAPFYGDYNSSELVFENLAVWNYDGQVEICWFDDQLALIRCYINDELWIFFPPVCATVANFLKGFKLIKEHYPEALLSGLSQKMVDLINIEGDLFLYDDYYSEYIYRPGDLASMQGGKYSRKRNLIAQFKKKYNYTFIAYNDSYFDQIKNFFANYREEGGASEDFEAICYALKNCQELNLFCDLLLVGDKIVGISIGTISIFNHAVILFEKSDYDYIGSGAIIVQYASQAHYSGCRTLSRQEDLGLPYLRKAKMSLHPLEKERKYTCVFNSQTSELHNLYLTTFDDSRDYVDFFFLHAYSQDRSFFVRKDGKIRSALHIIMKKMFFNERIIDLPFVVAASTAPEYQKQGLMREVMTKAFDSLIRKGYSVISLYPVNPAFYYGFGFVFYTSTVKLSSFSEEFECGLEQTVDTKFLSKMYDACLINKQGYIIRNEDDWNLYLNSLWQDGVVFDLIKKGGEVVGYVAHHENDIDEIFLCGKARPKHRDLDFNDAIMPAVDGANPGNMIRILNAQSFLSEMKFSRDVNISISIQISDRFVAQNNILINLSIRGGKATITPAKEPTLTVAIEELAKAIFIGEGRKELSFLFPNLKSICFDKF